MSGLGKGVKSRRRKDYANSRLPAIGVDTIAFAHQATSGDASIQFNTLVQPASWTLSGRVNPSASKILSATLSSFRDNVDLASNLRGLIVPTQYKIFNDHINFLTFTALPNEEFFVTVKDVIKTGNPIADVKPIYVPGVLPSGTTDFNIGVSVPLIGGVLVSRDGVQMFQNTNNSSTNLDGNYYIIPINAQEGSVLRFNTVAGALGANILVTGLGGMYQRPSFSSLQDIETIAGQVDQIIPTLAQLAQVPASNFQAAPNNVDLKAFGDKVNLLEKILNLGVVTDIPESVTYEGFTSINATLYIKFTNVLENSSNVLFSVDNTGDHTRYTFLRACKIVAKYSQSGFVGSSNISVQLFNISNVLIKQGRAEGGGSDLANAMITGEVAVGDYIMARRTQGSTVTGILEVLFSLTAFSIDKKKIKDLI